MFCRSGAAFILWFLGYPDQALKRSHEALALAQELSHPFSLAIALCFAADLHQLRREGQLTQERAEAAIALCREQEFPYWLAVATYSPDKTSISCQMAQPSDSRVSTLT